MVQRALAKRNENATTIIDARHPTPCSSNGGRWMGFRDKGSCILFSRCRHEVVSGDYRLDGGFQCSNGGHWICWPCIDKALDEMAKEQQESEEARESHQ